MQPFSFAAAVSGGAPSAAVPVADHVDAFFLEGDAVVVTVPAGARVAHFSASGGDFWITLDVATGDDAPEVPTADVTDGTAPALNPEWRGVEAVPAFSLIGGGSGEDEGVIVTVEWFS